MITETLQTDDDNNEREAKGPGSKLREVAEIVTRVTVRQLRTVQP